MEFNQFNDSLLENEEPIQVNENEEIETPTSEELETSSENSEENIETSEPEENSETEETVETDYSDNAVFAFLQSRGIKDPSKIEIENENGEIETVDFNNLSAEEQKNILDEISDPGITEYEANVINYMRKNNATLEQIIDYFANKRLEEYLNENPEQKHQQSYSIDDYTDDELFLADLKSKYPEFTDEELTSELEDAKSNEERFAKKIETLRTQYKAQEDQERAAYEKREAQQVEDLRNNLMTAASNFNEIALDYSDEQSDTLLIENDDKQQVISYLLDQDKDGKSQFVKDIEDSDSLFELAWLRIFGAEALSQREKYWKNVIAKERKEKQNLQNQIDKIKSKGSSTTVVNKEKTEENKLDRTNLYGSLV